MSLFSKVFRHSGDSRHSNNRHGYSQQSTSQPVQPVAPTANFTYNAEYLTVAFTNASTGTNPKTYSWDFGDLSPANTTASPSHTYAIAGDYTVVQTVTNAAGTDTESKIISVTAPPPAPVASFSTAIDALEVTFTDTSTNTPTSWLWDFGDSTTSTSQNPVHTYAAAGDYDVTLTATNEGGSDDYITTVTVASGFNPEDFEAEAITFLRNSSAQLNELPEGTSYFGSVNSPRIKAAGLLFEEATSNIVGADNGASWVQGSVDTAGNSIASLTRNREDYLMTVTGSTKYCINTNTDPTLGVVYHPRIVAYYTSSQIFISLVMFPTVDNGYVFTTPSNCARLRVVVHEGDATPQMDSGEYLVFRCQVEQKEYPTSFTKSTRAAEYAYVANNKKILPAQGTVELVIAMTAPAKIGTHYFWSIMEDAANGYNGLYLRHTGASGSGYYEFTIKNSTGTATTVQVADSEMTAGTSYRVSCKWDSSSMSLWINGVIKGSQNTPSLPSSLTGNFYLGSYPDGTGQPNCRMRDLHTQKEALTDLVLGARGATTALDVIEPITYTAPLTSDLSGKNYAYND